MGFAGREQGRRDAPWLQGSIGGLRVKCFLGREELVPAINPSLSETSLEIDQGFVQIGRDLT